MIKAVLFDIDGVLLDSFEANLRFYQELMQENGFVPPTREEFPSIFHMSMLAAIKHTTKLNDEKEILRIWEKAKGLKKNYDQTLVSIPEGAEEAILNLSKKYVLAIVTSRIKKGVFRYPKLAALREYFTESVSYEDTEKHKPYPDPLILAAKKLGVLTSECVYIGDTESDVQAAKSAKMKIITYPKLIEGADGAVPLFSKLPSAILKL